MLMNTSTHFAVVNPAKGNDKDSRMKSSDYNLSVDAMFYFPRKSWKVFHYLIPSGQCSLPGISLPFWRGGISDW